MGLYLIFFRETHTFKCGFKKEISINLSPLDTAIDKSGFAQRNEKLTGGKIAFTNDYRIIKEKMQIDKRNTLQKVRIRGQDKLPYHNGD